MIDLGYVISAIVPVILLAIFKDNLEPVWRLSLGLGIVPPLSVLYCKLSITLPRCNNANHIMSNQSDSRWQILKDIALAP